MTRAHASLAAFLAGEGALPRGDAMRKQWLSRDFVLLDEALQDKLPFQLLIPFVATTLDDTSEWITVSRERGVTLGPLTLWNERLLRSSNRLLAGSLFVALALFTWAERRRHATSTAGVG